MKNITFSIKLAGILLLGVLCFFFLNVGAEAEEDADTTFEMVEGASVRKVVPYGIKYTAKVGKGLYSSVKNYWIMIVPESYYNEYAVGDDYVAEISENATVAVIEADVIYSEVGDCYYASASLSNILYRNLNRNFIGIAFYIDGTGRRVYADFSYSEMVRNIALVASRALNGDETFSEEQKEFLQETVNKSVLLSYGMTESEANSYIEDDDIEYFVNDRVAGGNVVLYLDNSLGVIGVDIPCKWYSSDETVVSVTDSGEIIELSAGRVTITCKALGNIYYYDYESSIEEENYSDYLEFIELDGGSYEVKAKSGAVLPKNLTIPSSYNGKKVTAIANNGFRENTDIVSVTVGYGILTIGEYAFYNCTSLSSVVLENSVVSIGTQAFRNCSGLIDISLSSSLETIGTYAFYACSSIESLTLPSSVELIGSRAFMNCTSLSAVVFGDAENWSVAQSLDGAKTYLNESELNANAATYLTSTYRTYYWIK